MDPFHGVTGALGTLVIWGLFSYLVAGKDPYLDFTCVASRALITTPTNSELILIQAYSPLRNATFKVDGKPGNSTPTNEVGPYVCSLETENQEATTTVIVSSKNASLYPPRLTVTFDPNEEIKLQMVLRDNCDGGRACKYRWRDVNNYYSSREKLLHLDGLNKRSTIFHNFLVGSRERMGYVQVFVRECPSGYWNPEERCSLECSICLNGGMCHPHSGQCICPPGFSGLECQIVHGRDIFGQEGQYNCSASADPHDDGCIGKLFCLPEPFGCTCAAGYRGIDCSEGCEEGMYGANCEGICHCENNATCLADTGECVGSWCQAGWYGTNCQVQGLVLYEELEDVNINQMTNVTCILRNVSYPSDFDISLTLPNGTTIEANYFTQYEGAAMAGYIFVVVADATDSEYTCTDTMTLQKTFKLLSFEPPHLPNPPAISSSKVNAITITWKPWGAQPGDRGDPPVVNYIITYREAKGSTTAIWKTGDTTSFTVEGLMEDTEYEFRVTAVRPGVGGAGPPSPPAQGSTTCLVPGQPMNFTGIALNATSLQLNWSPPINTVCTVVTYTITYRLKQQGECSPVLKQSFLRKQKTTRSHSLVIGDLLPNILYKVMIRANTNTGVSQDKSIAIMTSESVPGPPIHVTTKKENSTIFVEWKAPGCADRNGKILGYLYRLLDYGGKIAEEGMIESLSIDGHIFENLLPCTKYGFLVKGRTSAGYGSFSQIQKVTSPSAVPDQVTDIQVSGKNSTALHVSWSAPTSTPCAIVGYTVAYTLVKVCQCEGLEVVETRTISLTDTETDLVVLYSDSEYVVVVRAKTDAGEGKGFNDTGRTLEEAPGQPVHVSQKMTTESSLTFKWEQPSCQVRHGTIQGFFYQLTEGEVIIQSGDTENKTTMAKLDGLRACTKYFFKVMAWTSAGNGSWSLSAEGITESQVPNRVRDLQLTPEWTGLHVSWSPPSDTPCNILNYSISYHLVKHLACDREEITSTVLIEVSRSNRTTIIANLFPYSEYVVSVTAVTSAGAGDAVQASQSTLQDVPGIPVAINNTKKSSRSVTFAWQPPACRERNATITEYIYKLVQTATWEPMTRNSVSANDTSATIDGLTPCTEYHFKVRARTSAGHSSFSEAVYVTTDWEAPDAVGDLQAEPLASSIHLNWKQPNDTSCGIINYNVTYKLIKVLQCLEEENTDIQEVTVRPSSTQHIIYGLLPASKYVVSVKADTVGGSGEGRTKEVYTYESVPGKPVAIDKTRKSSRSVTFAWQPPACKERNGTITWYIYKLVKSGTWKLFTNSVSANDTSATFDGLTPCTEYHFKVRAHTSVGHSSFSEAVYVTTGWEAPDAVGDLQAEPLATSIHLKWTQPNDTSCGIINYNVTYKLIKVLQCLEEENTDIQEVTVRPSSTQHMIYGLLPASKYVVSVKADTAGGSGEGRTKEVDTYESVPGIPVAINNTKKSSRSVTFIWQPPECRDRNGIIIEYIYKLVEQITRILFQETSVSPYVTSATFDGLTPCTRYHFEVRARTSAGHSSFRDAVYVTTDWEAPDAVGDLQAEPLASSIHLKWTQPNDTSCGIINYNVTYKLIKVLQCLEEENTDIQEVTVRPPSTQHMIYGLLPASKYVVSVKTDTVGGSREGRTKEVNTYESVPGIPVAIVSTRKSSRSVTFTWQPPACRERNGTITGYIYKLVKTATWELLKRNSESANVTSATIDGLTPCTEYHFKVRARTSVGHSSFSDAVYVTTEWEVPGEVSNVKASSTSHSIRLAWEPPTNIPCDITSYLISYKHIRYLQCSEISLDSTEHNVNAGNESRDYRIQELSPASTYLVSVRAETPLGTGDVVNINISTEDSVPSTPPEEISVVDRGPNHLSLSWKPPLCGQRNGPIISYTYTLVKSIQGETIESKTVATAEAFIEGLAPHVEYDFMVWANTEKGSGPLGHLVVRTAEVGGGPTPPDLSPLDNTLQAVVGEQPVSTLADTARPNCSTRVGEMPDSNIIPSSEGHQQRPLTMPRKRKADEIDEEYRKLLILEQKRSETETRRAEVEIEKFQLEKELLCLQIARLEQSAQNQ